MNVIAIKPQSVNAIAAQARATLAEAEEKRADAEDWFVRTGKVLIELKARVKETGGSWLDVLEEKVGISDRRARELMELATGKKTLAEQRNRAAQGMKQSRERRKTASRDAGRVVPIHPPVAPEEDEDAEYDPYNDPTGGLEPMEVRLNRSLQNHWHEINELLGEVIARQAYFDKEFPGWRDVEVPSDTKALMKEATTALASLVKAVTKR